MIITNLLSNMLVLTLFGEIPTNTPAFQEYALEVMVANAQSLGKRWNLDQSLITSNHITHFSATPYPEGISAGIGFADRYVFGTYKGGPIGFTDRLYHSDQVSSFPSASLIESTNKEHTVEGEDAKWKAVKTDIELQRQVAEQWAQLPNPLSLATAQQIAESSMRAFGVPLQEMRFKHPKVRRQIKWKLEDSFDVIDGSTARYKLEHPISYRLPYYEFQWTSVRGQCDIEVSGISTNIVRFEFGWHPHPGLQRQGFQAPNQLRLETPPNYLELLGLATNTVFVHLKSGTPPKYELWAP